VRRGLAFQAAQGPFRPRAGNGMAPFAAVSAQDTQQARKTHRRAVHRCLDNAVSHRATWASFLSRSRALQPKRRQRHGAPRCSKRSRHAAVSPTGTRRARCCIVRRWPAFQAAQGFISPSANNGTAPLATEILQNALPCRLQVYGERARFSSRPMVLQPKRWQRHGALRCSMRERHAAVPSKGVASVESYRAIRARFSSRLRVLQPKRRQRHGALRRSKRARHAEGAHDMPPCRPQVCCEREVASCDVGKLFKPPKGTSVQAPTAARRPSLQNS
jgi:hypothetical protein